MDADMDMTDSIEHGDLDSISESQVDETLRGFFPSRTTDVAPQRSPRSISTVDPRSRIEPAQAKSPAQRQNIAGSPLSISPVTNTRSRATSHASAQSAIPPSPSQSVAISNDISQMPGLQPTPQVPKVQRPILGEAELLRPEAATADMAKQLIQEQFGLTARSRLQPASPKRFSKPTTPSTQSAPTTGLSSKMAQKFNPALTQSKLSFPKAPPQSGSPLPKARPPSPQPQSPIGNLPDRPPLADEEVDEPDKVEYEVSKILSHHDDNSVRYYRVAWLGFPEEESTYLTEEELGGARKLLKRYKKSMRKRDKGTGGVG